MKTRRTYVPCIDCDPSTRTTGEYSGTRLGRLREAAQAAAEATTERRESPFVRRARAGALPAADLTQRGDATWT